MDQNPHEKSEKCPIGMLYGPKTSRKKRESPIEARNVPQSHCEIPNSTSAASIYIQTSNSKTKTPPILRMLLHKEVNTPSLPKGKSHTVGNHLSHTLRINWIECKNSLRNEGV